MTEQVVSFVGNSNVGKSFVAKYLTTDPASFNFHEIRVVPTIISKHTGHFFKIHECSGSSHCDSLRSTMYKKPKLSIICILFALDNNDSFNAVTSKYIPEIKRAYPEGNFQKIPPIFLIGTKNDLEGKDTKPIQKDAIINCVKENNLCCYFNISVKDGTNMGSLYANMREFWNDKPPPGESPPSPPPSPSSPKKKPRKRKKSGKKVVKIEIDLESEYFLGSSGMKNSPVNNRVFYKAKVNHVNTKSVDEYSFSFINNIFEENNEFVLEFINKSAKGKIKGSKRGFVSYFRSTIEGLVILFDDGRGEIELELKREETEEVKKGDDDPKIVKESLNQDITAKIRDDSFVWPISWVGEKGQILKKYNK